MLNLKVTDGTLLFFIFSSLRNHFQHVPSVIIDGNNS